MYYPLVRRSVGILAVNTLVSLFGLRVRGRDASANALRALCCPLVLDRGSLFASHPCYVCRSFVRRAGSAPQLGLSAMQWRKVDTPGSLEVAQYPNGAVFVKARNHLDARQVRCARDVLVCAVWPGKRDVPWQGVPG